VRQFKELGLDSLGTHAVLHACAVPHALEAIVQSLRSDGLRSLGFDAQKFGRRLAYKQEREALRALAAESMRLAGLGHRVEGGVFVVNDQDLAEARRRGILKPNESLAAVDTMPDEEDELDIEQREADAKQHDEHIVKLIAQKMAFINKELEEMTAELKEGGEVEQSCEVKPLQQLDAHGGNGVAVANGSSSGRNNSWGSDTSSSSSGGSSPKRESVVGNSSATNGHAANVGVAAVHAAGGDGPSWVLPEEVSKAEHALRWVSCFKMHWQWCACSFSTAYTMHNQQPSTFSTHFQFKDCQCMIVVST
jgi:hypothetical protein